MQKLEALAWASLSMFVRAFWLLFYPATPAWDGAIYHRLALRIASGVGYVDSPSTYPPFKATAFYPVGYPAVLAAFYALLGSHRWVAGLLNLLAAGVCTYGAVRLSQRLWGVSSARISGFLYVFAPGTIMYSSALMSEPLSGALLCVALLAAFRYVDSGKIHWALLSGMLLGLGGLVRPPGLLLAPVVAWMCVPKATWRAKILSLALFGFASAAAVAPWTIRNCRRLDACAVVSVNGGSNLWIGTDPQARGGFRPLRLGEGCDAERGEVSKDRCYGRLAMARIRRDPIAWIRLIPAKLRRMMAWEGTPISYLRDATGGRAFPPPAWQWFRLLTECHLFVLGLACLSALFAWGARRSSLAINVLVLCVFTQVAVYAVFFGVDRYHFALTPLLCALAGGVWSERNKP